MGEIADMTLDGTYWYGRACDMADEVARLREQLAKLTAAADALAVRILEKPPEAAWVTHCEAQAVLAFTRGEKSDGPAVSRVADLEREIVRLTDKYETEVRELREQVLAVTGRCDRLREAIRNAPCDGWGRAGEE